jgi:hypothetical protein
MTKLSVRAQNVLWNTFGHEPSAEEVRLRLNEADGLGWIGLLKLKNCGRVLADEIARWAGIEIPEKIAQTRCPLCRRTQLVKQMAVPTAWLQENGVFAFVTSHQETALKIQALLEKEGFSQPTV